MLLNFRLPELPRDDTDVVEKGPEIPWYLQQIEPYGLLLCFEGPSSEGDSDRWKVKERLSNNRVLATQLGRARLREVYFTGPFNAAESAVRGANVNILASFSKGFPENWQEIWPRPPPPPPDPLRRSKRLGPSSKPNDEDDSNIERSKSDEEEEEDEPLALRRPKRARQYTSESDKPFFDEDEMLLRALRKAEEKDKLVDILGLYEEDLTDEDKKHGEGSDDDEEDEAASKWSTDEIERFHHACLVLNPMSADFWKRMSLEFVQTRSPEACQLRWVYEAAAVKENRSKSGNNKSNKDGFTEEDAMKRTERAAKMGTAKFRRQVRNDWERVHVKQQRNNLSTPFREKLATDKLPDGGNFSDIKTPAATFVFGRENVDRLRKKLDVISESGEYGNDSDMEEKTEDIPSPDVLVEVNRDNLDNYLVGLVKEKKKLQTFQAKALNKKPPKTINGTSSFVSKLNALQSATGAEMESNGVQGTMTPGGTVKLSFAHRRSVDEETKQDDDDDVDSVW